MTLPLNPCGNRTRHTASIGCCAGCHRLFSSDSAFIRHRKDELVTDAEVDLTITRARRRAHPDTGGSVEQWLALESHVAVLIAGR